MMSVTAGTVTTWCVWVVFWERFASEISKLIVKRYALIYSHIRSDSNQIYAKEREGLHSRVFQFNMAEIEWVLFFL